MPANRAPFYYRSRPKCFANTDVDLQFYGCARPVVKVMKVSLRWRYRGANLKVLALQQAPHQAQSYLFKFPAEETDGRAKKTDQVAS